MRSVRSESWTWSSTSSSTSMNSFSSSSDQPREAPLAPCCPASFLLRLPEAVYSSGSCSLASLLSLAAAGLPAAAPSGASALFLRPPRPPPAAAPARVHPQECWFIETHAYARRQQLQEFWLSSTRSFAVLTPHRLLHFLVCNRLSCCLEMIHLDPKMQAGPLCEQLGEL